MSSPLVKLPYELLSFVVDNLDLTDTRNLSLTCRRLQFLFHERNIAKWILETKAPQTLEARCARVSNRYPSELRRLVKRREAIAKLSPYLVKIVAVAEQWIYENGVLCHIHDRELRILDLHGSQSTEIVVDIRLMLNKALPESRESVKYTFQPLYYSHGIVSCLYRHTKPSRGSWLVVFNPQDGQILTTLPLESTFKLFVRNNEKYLCYGVYSSASREEGRRWVARAFDLTSTKWLGREIDLPEPIGSDVNSTVCFEIFDGALYGLSSQTSLEAEEIDWMSYYTFFRLPLSDDGLKKIEHAPRRQLWRRCHFEGPIDDRWSFLRLVRDETTSQLKAIESRKEWLARTHSARRTYYTTELSFSQSYTSAASTPDSGQEYDDESAALCKTNEPDFVTAPPRKPQFVHAGDDNSTALMATLTKTPVRLYHSSCQTFLDLVDDPSPSEPHKQRIRLRGGSRRPWTPDEVEQRKRAVVEPRHQPQDTFDQQIADLYKHEDVVCWPPEQDPSRPNDALDQIYAVLNPPNHSGNITGAWDERSLVYAVEGTKGFRAIVFVSWDPKIYLEGTKPFPSDLRIGNPFCVPPEGSDVASSSPPDTAPSGAREGKNKELGTHRHAAQSNICCNVQGSTASREAVQGESPERWARSARAMYQDIAMGFHFAR
ncbi:hypothetical protein QBC47DRAFT_407438 [Echria macrotheca]|uniref:F-box domain-containing protein n=1 Tax=Echria macrotheca TaxID=438768 RepID=A0AAJ0B1G5_9PEZI|nr:hypothetical protein QBC47DRAFT_407438 [Echria macrotheca]